MCFVGRPLSSFVASNEILQMHQLDGQVLSVLASGSPTCSQAATISQVTVAPATARAAPQQVSHLPGFLGVLASVYNAITQSF
jgi:hypothetical protein